MSTLRNVVMPSESINKIQVDAKQRLLHDPDMTQTLYDSEVGGRMAGGGMRISRHADVSDDGGRGGALRDDGSSSSSSPRSNLTKNTTFKVAGLTAAGVWGFRVEGSEGRG
jgi:hypothetical protein